MSDKTSQDEVPYNQIKLKTIPEHITVLMVRDIYQTGSFEF
jgi:hypothetical protein